jgi:hypothetical protein
MDNSKEIRSISSSIELYQQSLQLSLEILQSSDASKALVTCCLAVVGKKMT